MSLKDSLRGAFTSVAADASQAALIAVQTRATGAFGLDPRLSALLPQEAAPVRVGVPNPSPTAAVAPQDKPPVVVASMLERFKRPLMLAGAVVLGLVVVSRLFRRRRGR